LNYIVKSNIVLAWHGAQRPSVAETAKRFAERPAGKERSNSPQIRDAAGGISARPSTAASLKRARSGAVMLCWPQLLAFL